jgi:hypothetical protein
MEAIQIANTIKPFVHLFAGRTGHTLTGFPFSDALLGNNIRLSMI